MRQLNPVNWRHLVTTPAPHLDLVIGGLPAGRFGKVSGADGAGKRMLLIQMALGVATGIPIAGGAIATPENTGPVVLIMGEDDEADYHRRVRTIVQEYKKHEAYIQIEDIEERIASADISLYCLNGKPLPLILSGPARNTTLVNQEAAALIEVMKDARLTILDPLTMFHQCDENSNGEMDDVGRFDDRLARQSGGAVIAGEHVAQDAAINGRDDHLAGRGATSGSAAARAVWVLRRPVERTEGKALIEGNEDPRDWRALRGSKVTHGPEERRCWLYMRNGVLFKEDCPALDGRGGGASGSHKKSKSKVEVDYL